MYPKRLADAGVSKLVDFSWAGCCLESASRRIATYQACSGLGAADYKVPRARRELHGVRGPAKLWLVAERTHATPHRSSRSCLAAPGVHHVPCPEAPYCGMHRSRFSTQQASTNEAK